MIKEEIMRKLLLMIIACVIMQGVQAQQNDSIRVLWVGNSFTFFNELPDMFQNIASTQGMNVSNTRVLKGGESFSGHLKNKNLIEILKKGGFDYIILQEQSSMPANHTAIVEKEVYPYAKQLNDLALKGSPKAKVIFYMTWGHKYGNIRATESYPLDHTYEEMQERLKTSYLEMAYDNKAWCAPVGMAWKTIRSQRPYLQLYRQDGFHPSSLGTYLAANTIFATIVQRHFQSDDIEGLERETAEYIQQIAQETVLNNLNLLNIK